MTNMKCYLFTSLLTVNFAFLSSVAYSANPFIQSVIPFPRLMWPHLPTTNQNAAIILARSVVHDTWASSAMNGSHRP